MDVVDTSNTPIHRVTTSRIPQTYDSELEIMNKSADPDNVFEKSLKDFFIDDIEFENWSLINEILELLEQNQLQKVIDVMKEAK